MKKTGIIIAIVVVLLIVVGVVVAKVAFSPKKQAVVTEEEQVETVPEVDSSVVVEAMKSKTKDNTVILRVKGMDGKMAKVAYELTYESEGLIKGVNSGSKPIEVDGEDGFEREVYLGTCSKNVCKPDPGVTKVSVVLEFTDTAGKKSQFSKEFEL
jgi:hypothetical protein